jgi:hypothetical protein
MIEILERGGPGLGWGWRGWGKGEGGDRKEGNDA